jgi:hypothetical protein
MECRRVQEERPRAETSGGQSVGRVDFLGGFLPAMAKREDTSLQVRHLQLYVSFSGHLGTSMEATWGV